MAASSAPRHRRIEGDGELADVLADLTGGAALLVGGAGDGVDRAGAAMVSAALVEFGETPVGDLQPGSRGQLDIGEELALDQLGDELGTEAAVEAEAANEEHRVTATTTRGRQDTGNRPRVERP